MNRIDLRLYAIVDTDNLGAENLAAFAGAAARNGATVMQYRDKHSGTRLLVERARAIHAALAGTGVPLLVNDRIDVALAAGVEGVHIGRDDMGAADARRLLGPDAIIGLTVKNEADAKAAIDAPIDYACIGGVFLTLSKDNPDAPVGLDGFRKLAGLIRAARPDMPIGAIAGMTLETAPETIRAGADGIAAIGALFKSGRVPEAVRAMRAAIERALEERA
jgi:thiamine-phosphate pyrophosphorylase